jgi:hypothetical protein
MEVIAHTNPWIETMESCMTKVVGADALGAKAIALLAATSAPNTASTYGSTIRRYFDFYNDYMLVPLAATPAHMAKSVAY